MRRTFTASRSPELGGRYHTDTPRMHRGHNETTMKRVQQIAWIHFFFFASASGDIHKRVLEGNVHGVFAYTRDLRVLGCSVTVFGCHLVVSADASLKFIVLRDNIYIKHPLIKSKFCCLH